MKFKKKLWISLILFILFGTVFSGWIFHQNTTREYLVFDNTTQLVTTERSEDNIRIEDVILPDSFQNQQSILFKTTHTRAEVLLDGEKIYEFGNDTDTLRSMKSPGSCWHIVDLPKTVMENTCRSGLFLYIQTTTEILSIFLEGQKETVP